MSSAVFSTSAARSRHFIFDAESAPETGPDLRRPQSTVKNRQSTILSNVVPASQLEVRPAPQMVSSGIAALDALTGGLPRGCLTEICGPASSGRTTLLLAALAAATQRGEFCAVVDASDALNPQSVAYSDVELGRLLWVRCGENTLPKQNLPKEKKTFKSEQQYAEHSLEQLLHATDLLLESGGFGLIALDLGDLPPQTARRIPLTTWFRFRRAVEHTPTVLLSIERQSIAGSCSSLLLKLESHRIEPTNLPASVPVHTQLLTELKITAEIVRSRMERQPPCSEITFAGKTAWAG